MAEPPGIPGWVKAFGLVVLVLLLLIGVLVLTGGHGPAQHMP